MVGIVFICCTFVAKIKCNRTKMKLKGHTAIVTGGAGLLGKAFCQTLLENGAKVSYNMR